MSTPAKDRRPSAQDYTKWEKPLPFNLEDFMNQYVAWNREGVEHPEWKQTIVAQLEVEIKDMIRVHWKQSSKTRKLFIAMNKADVWEDEKAVTMRLTKRNLATLDPRFLPNIQQHCLETLTNLIMAIREEGENIIAALYPTDEEVGAFRSRMEGTDNEAYTFENYGKHLELQKDMRKEIRDKFAIIEYLRQREIWIQNLVKFEEKHLDWKPSQGAKNVNNWLPKFRAEAASLLIKSNKRTDHALAAYERNAGKTFLVYGRDYRVEFYEKQIAQVAKVKTNFRGLTAQVLFFDNPDGTQEGRDVCGPVLHESLASIVAEAPQGELFPPAMPKFSDELEFTFEYY